jgi:hypothetical protein
MPTWSSFADFADTLGKISKDVQTSTPRTTRAMADESVRIAARQARQSLGPDGAFTRWGKGGKPNPLTLTVRRFGDDHQIQPTKFSAGAWTVAESGRRSYQGGTKREAGVYLRRKTNEYAIRRRIVKRNVAATGGKGTATATLLEMDRELPRVARDRHRADLIRRVDMIS